MARVLAIGRPGPRAVSRFGGLTAVAAKELRGRMRGRRAFVTVTFYVGVLALFMVAIYQITKNSAESQVVTGGSSPFVSAQVGQAIFAGILLLETLIVLFLAPAFTTGAISLEREKQTLDLLAVTPLSSLAIVLGKLFSALTWVLILIFSSVPLTAIVFVFGGVAPEDIARGYAYVLALAIGLGALGLLFSAAARRTQAATVLSYFTVLLITIGTGVGWLFWQALVAPSTTQGTQVIVKGVDDRANAVAGTDGVAITDVVPASTTPARPPEALLWLNPVVAVADLACGPDTNAYSVACQVVSGVTGRQSVVWSGGTVPVEVPPVPVVVDRGGKAVAVAAEANADFQSTTTRDAFWPQSAAAWLAVGAISVLLSIRLVRPGGRLMPRLRRRRAPPEVTS